MNKDKILARINVLNMAYLSLFINLAYSIYNGVLGFVSVSRWYITLFAYYIILSIMRFSVLIYERKEKNLKSENQYFIMRFSGVMLLLLSVILIGTVILSNIEERASKHHEIVMITIALYAFVKVTLAIINTVKARKINSPVIKTLRSISFADAVVSIFSMQRSMLVTFEGMQQREISILNLFTGTATCLTVIISAIILITERENKNGNIKTCKSKRKNRRKGS